MEQYDFSPKEVFKAVSKEDYLTFLTYSLEYRALVMEQLSHEREMEYIRNNPKPEDRIDGYGVMLLDFTIRDLKGIGMAHLGSDGRALVKAALGLGLCKLYYIDSFTSLLIILHPLLVQQTTLNIWVNLT